MCCFRHSWTVAYNYWRTLVLGRLVEWLLGRYVELDPMVGTEVPHKLRRRKATGYVLVSRRNLAVREQVWRCAGQVSLVD